ncbi:conglutin alpha 2-like [Anopheles merus]|uniref:conglutin alpha 2-like n=1 Tax=Anopheles merus TaxID=30066 RepID=UPI001BE45CF3|nr:conglutin alpha 2-like [Anopheles merus]
MDSEPEPDPEPPEKDKSASRVNNKTVKRKRKEKEKGGKVKSKKLKTETSDHSDGEDGLQRDEDRVNLKSEEEPDWCEPERKRYKKDHHGDVGEDEPATTPLQAGDGSGMQLAGGKMDDLKEEEEEEIFQCTRARRGGGESAAGEREKEKQF